MSVIRDFDEIDSSYDIKFNKKSGTITIVEHRNPILFTNLTITLKDIIKHNNLKIEDMTNASNRITKDRLIKLPLKHKLTKSIYDSINIKLSELYFNSSITIEDWQKAFIELI